MHAFYQVAQGMGMALTAYAIRLEKAMAQIRTKHPQRINEKDIQQKPKDHLFNEVCKKIQNSIQYLYTNP